MDAAFVALRLGDRRRHLRDAVPGVLTAVVSPRSAAAACVVFSVLLPTLVYASVHDHIVIAVADSLPSLPRVGPIAIRPRVLAGYGSLVTAGMLSLLYLYRGRSFIVYWIGAWLLTAAALGLASGLYADATLDRTLTGLTVLFTVWASGLVLLSAETFSQQALRWS